MQYSACNGIPRHTHYNVSVGWRFYPYFETHQPLMEVRHGTTDQSSFLKFPDVSKSIGIDNFDPIFDSVPPALDETAPHSSIAHSKERGCPHRKNAVSSKRSQLTRQESGTCWSLYFAYSSVTNPTALRIYTPLTPLLRGTSGEGSKESVFGPGHPG